MSNKQPLLVIWWPKALQQMQAQQEGRTLQVRYEVLAAGGNRLHAGVESVSKLPKTLPCLVLLSPIEVGLFAVAAPKLSGKKLKDALPFVVEPFLLNEPEENHVNMWHLLEGSTSATALQLATVVSKSRVRDIASACKQYGLKLRALSCESLRQTPTGQARAWFSGDDFLLVDGIETPLITNGSQAQLLGILLERRLPALADQAIHISASHWLQLKSLVRALPEPLQNKFTDSEKTESEPLNALINRPLVSSEELRKLGLQPTHHNDSIWKRLAPPALVLITVLVIGLNILAFKMRAIEKTLDNQIAQTYTRAMPSTPMVADPLLLMEREKRILSSGLGNQQEQGLAFLLHEVGQAMNNAPFNSLNGLTWKDNTLSMRFNANVGEDIQTASLRTLKAKKLDAKWQTAKESRLPVLQVKSGTRP